MGGVEGSRVEGGKVCLITLFECFLREEGERFWGFGGILTTSNPSFLISPNLRDLEGE